MANEQDILNDILEAETSAIGTFEPLWTEASRNKKVHALDQWGDEKDKIIKQNRIPYVFDEISHPINVLLGTQRDTRFDIHFYERTIEDGSKVEVMNAVWKYFADLYDFMSVESDVFQDGVVSKYGVFQCRMDYDKDFRGNLRVERTPYNEVIWDTNFRQYDLSDAYWMARLRYYRRKELERKYPEKTDLIKSAGLQTNWAGMNEYQKMMWFKPDNDLVGTREFYEKDFVRKYYIRQDGEPLEMQFKTKKDAEKKIAEIQSQMERKNFMLRLSLQQPQPMPQFDVKDMSVRVIKKSVVVIDGVLEEPEEQEMNDFPYSVYFPYFDDGKFWSVVDRLYYPQMFKNRMMTMIDHWVGTSAKGLLWIDPKTPKVDADRIEQQWGKTGGVLRGIKTKPELIEGKGVQPQLFGLMEIASSNIAYNGGGENYLGSKQTASESGRAVLARQAQAGLDNFIPLDNLRRTKQNLGEKIAWYLANEVTTARKLRIVGDELAMQVMETAGIGSADEHKPNVRYVEVNTEDDNTIEGLEVDIIVDEAPHSPTKNNAIIGALTDAGKAGVMSIPPPPALIPKLLDIPYSFKQEWIAYIQQQQQQPPEPKNKVSINYKDLDVNARVQAQKDAGIEPNERSVEMDAITNNPIMGQVSKAILTPKEQAMGNGLA